MATAGISRSGRPEAAPTELQAAKAKSDPCPKGAKWTKGDPQGKAWAPWEPQESLLFPGQRAVSRRGLHGAEGTGDRPSAAPSRALSAGRSRRAQRSGLHSRPPPLFPLRKPGGSYPPRSVAAAETPEAGLDAPGIHGALEIHRKAPPPRAPLGPPAFCPQSRWLPQTGGGGEGEGERLAPPPPFDSCSRCSSYCQINPGIGSCDPPPTPSRTPRDQKTGKGGGGRADEAGAGSEALERRELTCKRAVLLGSGLLDHDVDILLNSLLP